MSTPHDSLQREHPFSIFGGAVATLGITVAALAALTVTAGTPTNASSAPTPEPTVAAGPSIPLGRGSARVYVTSVDGHAVEVGVALTEKALLGLPTEHDHHGGTMMPDGHMMFEHVLDFPSDNPTPYRHVSLNWNPGGHEPPGTYDVPHFDFHFQLITDAERRRIVPEDPAWETTGPTLPEERFMPRGYVPIPPAVPLMGVHWIDPTTPELNGEPFTETFIFGSWNGRVIFAEPMITAAFLRSKPDFTEELPLPPDLSGRSHHPTRYHIRWNRETREYRVSLGGFVSD